MTKERSLTCTQNNIMVTLLHNIWRNNFCIFVSVDNDTIYVSDNSGLGVHQSLVPGSLPVSNPMSFPGGHPVLSQILPWGGGGTPSCHRSFLGGCPRTEVPPPPSWDWSTPHRPHTPSSVAHFLTQTSCHPPTKFFVWAQPDRKLGDRCLDLCCQSYCELFAFCSVSIVN